MFLQWILHFFGGKVSSELKSFGKIMAILTSVDEISLSYELIYSITKQQVPDASFFVRWHRSTADLLN